MAEKTFNLSKKIISNQRAKELHSNDFSELTISEEKYDSEKIKRIYNDVFYQIPKRGKESHESIVIQSTDYVHPEINENLDDSIRGLEEKHSELNEEYLKTLLPPKTQEHPIFPNGLFVQEGDITRNIPIEPLSDIWFIQQGFKRKLGRNGDSVNGYWHRLLRQVQYEEVFDKEGEYRSLKTSPNFQYLTPDDLNSIPDGEDINQGGDLSIDPLLGIDPQYIYREIKLALKCEGVEKFYILDSDEDGYQPGLEDWHEYVDDPMKWRKDNCGQVDYQAQTHRGCFPRTGGYWWVDTNASCQVSFHTDIDPTETFEVKTKTVIISAGGWKEITISRDSKFYDHSINNTSDPLDPEYYNVGNSYQKTKWAPQWHGSGGYFPELWAYKKWGKDHVYPAITWVKNGSRLASMMKSPYTHDLNGNSTILDSDDEGKVKWRWMNGTINNYWEGGGKLGQGDILNNVYERHSLTGFRMINTSCVGPLAKEGCYGALGVILSDLKSHLYDINGHYYQIKASRKFSDYSSSSEKWFHYTAKGAVYGQPIINVEGSYCVFLENFQLDPADSLGGYWAAFFSLKTGSVFAKRTNTLHKYVRGYTRFSDKKFNWLRQGDKNNIYINNPTIYFPGLQVTTHSGQNHGTEPGINSKGTGLDSIAKNLGGTSYDNNPFNPRSKARGTFYLTVILDVEGSNTEYILSDKIKQR